METFDKNSETGNVKVLNLIVNKSERSPTTFDYLEYISVAWFSLELITKFVVTPSKLKFFTSVLNWIDLIANLWFYIDISYNYFLIQHDYDTHPAWSLFGTIRIMRLFRLSNHHTGLKVIIASLGASVGILKLIFIFVAVAIIVFASMVYHAEKLMAGTDGRNGMSGTVSGSGEGKFTDSNLNQFHSMFEALWFSIASLTTVGFGDYCPKTPLGMIFGAMCTVAGVIMIDLPMPIIVENFANYYNHVLAQNKFPKKLRRRVITTFEPSVTNGNSFNKNSSFNRQISLQTPTKPPSNNQLSEHLISVVLNNEEKNSLLK
jgi:potassium voltage-gated channel Shaw-related subfamily C member 1